MNETIIRLQTSTYQELNYYNRDPGWSMESHFHDHYQILVVLSGYLEVEIADSLLIYLLENHQKANGTDPRILKLEKYLDSRIKNNISLKETANYLNLSIPHLERLCHRYFGRGLIDKTLEKKADLACRILTESDHTIEEIAWELGFSSQAYFSRFFNKRVGMTPSNYRQRFILYLLSQNPFYILPLAIFPGGKSIMRLKLFTEMKGIGVPALNSRLLDIQSPLN
jgi:AraC-like DNA-binding protein